MSRFRLMRPAKARLPKPRVSLVVWAHAGWDELNLTLSSIHSQSYRPIETVVLDQGLSRPVQARLRAYQRQQGISVMRRAKPPSPQAILAVIRYHAHGSIIVLLEAGTTLWPDSLERLVRQFDDPRIGAVLSRNQTRGDHTVLARVQGLADVLRQPSRVIYELRPTALLTANGVALRKQMLRSSGWLTARQRPVRPEVHFRIHSRGPLVTGTTPKRGLALLAAEIASLSHPVGKQYGLPLPNDTHPRMRSARRLQVLASRLWRITWPIVALGSVVGLLMLNGRMLATLIYLILVMYITAAVLLETEYRLIERLRLAVQVPVLYPLLLLTEVIARALWLLQGFGLGSARLLRALYQVGWGPLPANAKTRQAQ